MPVHFADRYSREFLAGPDGARFVIENEIWNASGEPAAKVRSTGGWLDLRQRKLVAPPAPLFDTFLLVPRTAEFAELPSLRSHS